MSYISPTLEENFNSLGPELKDFILKRDVQLYTMEDLMKVLEEIVSEAEVEECNTEEGDFQEHKRTNQYSIQTDPYNLPINTNPPENIPPADKSIR